MIVFAVGGLLFFTFHYRKLIKYFLEDSKEANMEAIVIESLERSVYPLLFGSTHALFLDNLYVQTILLGVIEGTYLLAKIYALRSITPRFKFKVCMLLLTSIIRLIFIITFYLYAQNWGTTVINEIHQDLVWIYLLCWVV